MATATQTRTRLTSSQEAQIARDLATAMEAYVPSPAVISMMLAYIDYLKPQRVTLVRPEDRVKKDKQGKAKRPTSVITFRRHHATEIWDGTRLPRGAELALIWAIATDRLVFAARRVPATAALIHRTTPEA